MVKISDTTCWTDVSSDSSGVRQQPARGRFGAYASGGMFECVLHGQVSGFPLIGSTLSSAPASFSSRFLYHAWFSLAFRRPWPPFLALVCIFSPCVLSLCCIVNFHSLWRFPVAIMCDLEYVPSWISSAWLVSDCCHSPTIAIAHRYLSDFRRPQGSSAEQRCLFLAFYVPFEV